MKKINKTQLRLNKEVITSLSRQDLLFVKGGAGFTDGCQQSHTLPCEISKNGECPTVLECDRNTLKECGNSQDSWCVHSFAPANSCDCLLSKGCLG